MSFAASEPMSLRGLRVSAAIVALVVACAALTACAPSSGGGAAEDLDLQLLMEETTDFQRAIIADGVVTSSEYEKALLARRDCIESAGGQPGDIYEKGNNELTFDYEITAGSDEELERVQDEADACIPEYFAEVGAVWAYQQLLSPEEQENVRPQVIACLSGAGAAVAAEADLEDILESMDADGEISAAERACIDEFPGFFSTWRNSDDAHSGHDD